MLYYPFLFGSQNDLVEWSVIYRISFLFVSLQWYNQHLNGISDIFHVTCHLPLFADGSVNMLSHGLVMVAMLDFHLRRYSVNLKSAM
jgi:hypothetical protein